MKNINLQVSGRLGNQLFEWAYAHDLALRFNCRVQPFVDSRHFDSSAESIFLDPILKCDLLEFQTRHDRLGTALSGLDKLANSSNSIAERIEVILGMHRERDAYQIHEPKNKPRLVTGFFINSTPALNNASHIKQHLESKFVSLSVDSLIGGLLQGQPYQAVHIRRGDFIGLKGTFGLLDEKWYLKNLDPTLPIVLATDDLNGANHLIKALKPRIVLAPSEFTAWQTLGIIAHANRLILSNSTFSWWSGFYATQLGKSVYYPTPYYRTKSWERDVLFIDSFIASQSSFES